MSSYWVAEILAWSVNSNDFKFHIIWSLAATGNLLEGVLVFLILVCNKSVLVLLLQTSITRFNWFTAKLRITDIAMSTTDLLTLQNCSDSK